MKETEGGISTVCEVMQRYENLAIHKVNIEKIQKMIRRGDTKEEILELDYTEEEYAEAEAGLCQTV